MIRIKNRDELARMRDAGRLLAEIFKMLEELIRPGVDTLTIDQYVHRWITKMGAEPAFLGYRGYPATICASPNNVVVHGIPAKDVILRDGDIIGIDIGLRYMGVFSDSARTYAVGSIDDTSKRLLEVTENALKKGINVLSEGKRLGELSNTIQRFIEERGLSVVRDFVGHGIGIELHEDPMVPNYGDPKSGPILQVGMTLAIEPMVNVGSYEVEVLDDGWTVVTKDGKRSAHFEHTVAITENGVEIFTEI